MIGKLRFPHLMSLTKLLLCMFSIGRSGSVLLSSAVLSSRTVCRTRSRYLHLVKMAASFSSPIHISMLVFPWQVRKRIAEQWGTVNKDCVQDKERIFTPCQEELFSLMNSYKVNTVIVFI